MTPSSAALWIFLLFTLQQHHRGRCQQDLPQILRPLVLRMERHWNVLSWTPVGSVVTYATVDNNDDHRVVFKLESLGRDDRPLPFTIDNATGAIYTNDTLRDRVGEELHLYVRVHDPSSPVSLKTEVLVRFLNDSSSVGGVGSLSKHPPSLLSPLYLPEPPTLHPGFGEDAATELTGLAFSLRPPTATPKNGTIPSTSTSTSSPSPSPSPSPMPAELNDTPSLPGATAADKVNNVDSATAASATPPTEPGAATAVAAAPAPAEVPASNMSPPVETAAMLVAMTSLLAFYVFAGAAYVL